MCVKILLHFTCRFTGTQQTQLLCAFVQFAQTVRRQQFLTLNPHPQRKRRCTLPFVRFVISIFHSSDEFYNLIQDQAVELISFKNLNRSVAFLFFSQLSTVTPIACKMAKSIRFHRECDGVWTRVGDKLQTTNCWAHTHTPVLHTDVVWTSKEIRVCVHLTETFCEFNFERIKRIVRDHFSWCQHHFHCVLLPTAWPVEWCQRA